MHFELVAPERVLFSGEVEAVMLPGSEGDMTVLPGHAPLMAMLKTGFVQITDHKDDGRRVLIRGGFAEINQQGVTVLAENARPVEEVTPETIAKEIEAIEIRWDAAEDPKLRQELEGAIAQLKEAREALKF
jgi:F-type H+-transporting ATPase subunit epsilon